MKIKIYKIESGQRIFLFDTLREAKKIFKSLRKKIEKTHKVIVWDKTLFEVYISDGISDAYSLDKIIVEKNIYEELKADGKINQGLAELL